MRTYNETINLVRNWANRDKEVVSDTIIADCLNYAADKAYRKLRIPPLEQIITYNSEELIANTQDSNNGTLSFTKLLIPSNLIEFIQIRALDEDGKTTRVFNEKSDVRTFFDQYAEKYSNIGYWTRQANNILIAPGFQDGSSGGTEFSVELYYYGRLFALDARYDVTAANANISSDYISEVTSNNPIPVNLKTNEEVESNDLKKVTYTLDSDDSVVSIVFYETSVSDDNIPSAPEGQTRTIETNTYYGVEVYNWLRDENERIILNGALAELFIYLNEPESAQRYLSIFELEIEELNREETKRKASGGNVQVNFNSNGLI
jgi:hypothetical protein